MDILIRDGAPDDALIIARIYVEGWRTAYAGFVPEQVLAGLDPDAEAPGCREFISATLKGNTLLKVACVDGVIAGYISAGEADSPGMAEIFEVFVRPCYGGRSIGIRLMDAACQHLLARGFDSLEVWCWKENPYIAFYRRLRGTVSRTTSQALAGKDLRVLVFTWAIADLVQEIKAMSAPGNCKP